MLRERAAALPREANGRFLSKKKKKDKKPEEEHSGNETKNVGPGKPPPGGVSWCNALLTQPCDS